MQALSTRGRWGPAVAAALMAALAWFGVSRYRAYLETYASPITNTTISEIAPL